MGISNGVRGPEALNARTRGCLIDQERRKLKPSTSRGQRSRGGFTGGRTLRRGGGGRVLIGKGITCSGERDIRGPFWEEASCHQDIPEGREGERLKWAAWKKGELVEGKSGRR